MQSWFCMCHPPRPAQRSNLSVPPPGLPQQAALTRSMRMKRDPSPAPSPAVQQRRKPGQQRIEVSYMLAA